MNTLVEEIENVIQMSINNFLSCMSKKYNLDYEELLQLWDNKTDNITIQCKPSASSSNRTSPAKTDSGSSVKGEGCPYVYTKGEKEGETCNIKPKGNVVYCTRHKKYEGTEPKQKKLLPSTKKSIAGTTTVKKSPQKKTVNTVLRKNKALDKLWHSATCMVFKSAKERVVIGKCVDDKLQPLTNDDIEVCMAHSFAFEKDTDDVKKSNNKSEDSDLKTSNEESEDEKEVIPKVVPDNKQAKCIKKSIAAAITETKIQAKDVEVIPKVVPDNKQAKCIKKSIAAAITETKIQAKDVEEILGELQIKSSKKIKEKDLFGESDSAKSEGEDEDEEEELIDE
jgi:hypothetical protein